MTEGVPPVELLVLLTLDILGQVRPDKLHPTKEHLKVELAHQIFIKQAPVAINYQVKVNFQEVEAGILELTKQDMRLVEIFRQEEVDQDSIEKAPQVINQLISPELE